MADENPNAEPKRKSALRILVGERAVEDLLAEVSDKIGGKTLDDVRASKNSMGSKKSVERNKKEFKSLFLLDGTQILNIFKIPLDAKILLVSEEEYAGKVEFEDFGP